MSCPHWEVVGPWWEESSSVDGRETSDSSDHLFDVSKLLQPLSCPMPHGGPLSRPSILVVPFPQNLILAWPLACPSSFGWAKLIIATSYCPWDHVPLGSCAPFVISLLHALGDMRVYYTMTFLLNGSGLAFCSRRSRCPSQHRPRLIWWLGECP